MLTRPFTFYADVESSLVKIQRRVGNTHRHVPDSVGLYFVCTYDRTRNKYYQFVGEDFVVYLITKLNELSDKCIEEMKINTDVQLTAEDKP